MSTATNTLALQGFGARLRVKDGLFAVTVPDLSGANNHREAAFAPTTVSTILLHPKTSVSADALLLAQQHGVDVLVVDDYEMPQSFLAGLHPPASILIWKQQLLLHHSPRGLAFARDWLCAKTRRQIEWLTKMRSYRHDEALASLDRCLAVLRDTLVCLANAPLHPLIAAANRLRGIEGSSQRLYLQTLSELLPPQSRFAGRSRQPADDLFNALLNYGYGILYRRVEKALWEVGLNPYIGFLHGSPERHHKTLLFDFVEPYRPWIDKIVFDLCARKEINAAQHTQPSPDGGLWLNKSGKQLLVERVNELFERRRTLSGDKERTFSAALEYETKALALELARRGLPDTDVAPEPGMPASSGPLTGQSTADTSAPDMAGPNA